jgi:hypothetical protein
MTGTPNFVEVLPAIRETNNKKDPINKMFSVVIAICRRYALYFSKIMKMSRDTAAMPKNLKVYADKN